MRTTIALIEALVFVLQGCTSRAASGNPTRGDVIQAKLCVYRKLLQEELPQLPKGWEQKYSAIFLGGDEIEQKIFPRELGGAAFH